MDSRDWYDYGQKIGELVQTAIDSNNFRSLNQSITDTINDAIENFGLGTQPRQGRAGYGTYRASGPNAYTQAKSSARGAGSRSSVDRLMDEAQRQLGEASGKAQKKMTGVGRMAVGYAMAALSGLGTLATGFIAALTGLGLFRLLSIFLLITTIVFVIMGVRGGSARSRYRQMEQYLRVMGDRDTVTFEELAAASGKSVKAVRADVKEMISAGMFPGAAYVDDQETCLMTSRSAYQQYQETMAAYRQRKSAQQQEEALRREAEKDMAAYPEETQKILSEGKAFIQHIHEANDQIPGEEISEKLSRLEEIVTRIFDEVAADPGSAPDLHRMMHYYLPTTQKLVDAYVDLDKKQLSGRNVVKTKREIEASLDTINVAFEALLDSFFQDAAMDISSDISTLKTMMARDGLTGRDFAPGEKIKTVHGDLKPQEPSKEETVVSTGAAAPQTGTPRSAGTGAGQGAASAQGAGSGIRLTFGDPTGAAAAAAMPEEERQ